MPKKKKITDDSRVALDAAVGICAWALVVETLVVLESRGILRRKDHQRIIGGALAAVEMLASETDWHPGFPVATEMLSEQLRAWTARRG